MPVMWLRLWATIKLLTATLRQSIEVWIAIGSLRQLKRHTTTIAQLRQLEKIKHQPQRERERETAVSAAEAPGATV